MEERVKTIPSFGIVRGQALDDANPPHPLGFLRSRCQRPRHCRPAEQRDDLAPIHSITSSARARNDSGIVRPIAFAVLRLMTSSNLVGCSTGMSFGCLPCKIFCTSLVA